MMEEKLAFDCMENRTVVVALETELRNFPTKTAGHI
jgi:hypothetical protein